MDVAGASACKTCSVGTGGTTGNTICLCPAGTFSSVAGLCSGCAAGYYSGSSGASVCTPCAQGLNSPVGSSVCLTSYDPFVVVADLGLNYALRKVGLKGSIAVTTVTQSAVSYSYGVAISPQGGYLLYSMRDQYSIYKYTFSTGVTEPVAGVDGTYGYINGGLGVSILSTVSGIPIAPDGSYALIMDRGNNMVRKLDLTTYTVSTLAGSMGGGYLDGSGTSIGFYTPHAAAISWNGTFALVVEYSGCRVRRLDLTRSPVTSSIVGGDYTKKVGTSISTNGIGTSARFYYPQAITVSSDSVWAFVSEYAGSIRVIQLNTLTIGTLVSTGVFSFPGGLFLTPIMDYMLVTNSFDHKIWKVPFKNGVVGTTIDAVVAFAGSGTASELDSSTGLSAAFNQPFAMDGWRCGLAGYGAVNTTHQCAQCPPGKYATAVGGICKTCATATGYGSTTCV